MIDRVAALGAVFGFSLSLGVATVAIPLLALGAGYAPAVVGFLVATSAASQLTTRFSLPWLLGRFPDRTLIIVSCVIMVLAFGLLILSTALIVFAAAQLLQGVARAIFWTSSQTHAIRGEGPALRGLVDLNVCGNAGTLVGPALGGSLAAIGLPVALTAAMVGATVAAVLALLLRRLPPYDRRRSAGTTRLIRRAGVDVACWASVAGGTWWSMMGSFVPVILVGAGFGSVTIGWLITASEGAGAVALLALRRLPEARVERVVKVAALLALTALVTIALVPAGPIVYAILLLVGGASSGTVTTLGPALASLAAGPHEQGDALALSGTFRAGALLAAPATVGAMLAIVPLAAAMTLVAAGVAVPGLVLAGAAVNRRARR
jgi:predicted MFS family arabinose efflux permease